MKPLAQAWVWLLIWFVWSCTGPATLGPRGAGSAWGSEAEGEVLAHARPPVPPRLPPPRSPGRGGRGRGERATRSAEPVFNAEPTPEQREVARRRAADAEAVRIQQKRYWELKALAERQYPDKVGRYEEHHLFPLYLGGPKDGATFRLPAAYHQLITNEFRRQHPYGRPRPSPERAREIMLDVYSRYPIPQLVGIEAP